MDDWMKKDTCDRCGKSTADGFSMSMFNEDKLCNACWEEEHAHPDYFKAMDADHAHVKAGDWKFKGIGWPGKDGRIKP